MQLVYHLAGCVGTRELTTSHVGSYRFPWRTASLGAHRAILKSLSFAELSYALFGVKAGVRAVTERRC